MAIKIGEVHTFPNPECSKAQVVKILEESAEVFSAWEMYHGWPTDDETAIALLRGRVVDECADTIMAVCNLIAALGVDDMRESMRECEQRNRERGRM